ncbi:MAG: hypothetical protein EZS28_048978 [Streblomastix strix]|uniref:Uncharacterized protein n=1 Tax=Streblomastix strix TaxID=222440 RepID=A0A5J4TDF2_9EUKA|nr:MAG: hypothetical protein EZS28_048978 [Streblomastix strix]
MPKDNKVQTSISLQMHDIWKNSIGFDPYAPTDNKEFELEQKKKAAQQKQYEDLMNLARNTQQKKVRASSGHFAFECRNFSIDEDEINDLQNAAPKHSDDSSSNDEENKIELTSIQKKKKRKRKNDSKDDTSDSEKEKKRKHKHKHRKHKSRSSSSSSGKSQDKKHRRKHSEDDGIKRKRRRTE